MATGPTKPGVADFAFEVAVSSRRIPADFAMPCWPRKSACSQSATRCCRSPNPILGRQPVFAVLTRKFQHRFQFILPRSRWRSCRTTMSHGPSTSGSRSSARQSGSPSPLLRRNRARAAAVGVGILTCTAITPKHANITQELLRLTTGRASAWRPAFVPQGPRSRLKVRSPLSTATSGETSS